MGVSAQPLPPTQTNMPSTGSMCAGIARGFAVSVPCLQSLMPNPITLTQNAKLLPCKTQFANSLGRVSAGVFTMHPVTSRGWLTCCSYIVVPLHLSDPGLSPLHPALQCEGGQVYEDCYPSCPLTCHDRSPEPRWYCQILTWLEGCFCPEGTLLHGLWVQNGQKGGRTGTGKVPQGHSDSAGRRVALFLALSPALCDHRRSLLGVCFLPL